MARAFLCGRKELGPIPTPCLMALPSSNPYTRGKVMDNEGKFIVGASIVLIVALISIPWSISHYFTTTSRTAIEAGYEQQSLPGQSGVHWVKAKNAEHD
jgi:hypothetical protein